MTSYAQSKSDMVRIGIFYDGHYFLQVSNFYNYVHDRRSRISIRGLHDFIRKQVAIEEEADFHRCQIIDAHYFRGRLSASEASQRGNLLYFERAFDDILMSEGVTVHYLPVRNFNGRWQEKGIDVWLALEAFEMAFYKRFDVVVLLAADGGSRVMLLHWNFEYTDEEGSRFSTRTSNDLVTSVTYPIPMHELMDDFSAQSEAIVTSLFVPKSEAKTVYKPEQVWNAETNNGAEASVDEMHESDILSLKEGYGFIRFPPNNVFFHFSSVSGHDFNDLQVGDRVQFTLEPKEDGRMMAKEVFIMD
jgi:cold shock CspA family protein/uncharacterized LabA/DUF88 family protein